MLSRVLVAVLATAAFAQVSPTSTGVWSPFAKLRDARAGACAVRIGTGQILVAGGAGASGPLASAEIVLADATVQAAAPMNAARANPACTALADGRVLVTGGDTAELYDPQANMWTPIAAARPRSGETATLLSDGRVLVAGGTEGDTPSTLLEIFDPAANTLSIAPAQLQTARRGHAAVLLADGRAAIIGGNNSSGPLRSVEIFDPVAGAITPGPDLALPRTEHSATVLEDGSVLVAGGSARGVDLNTAEIIDAAAQQSTLLLSRMALARSRHFALVVPGNGGVLLGGGSYLGQPLAITELFQPDSGTFQLMGNLTAPRSGIAAAPLYDGTVIAMGGINGAGPQSGCGIFSAVTFNFSRSTYHPNDTATVSASNIPGGVQVSFTLELLQGGTTTAIPTRLLTSSVVTSGPTLGLGGFSGVPIVKAISTDPGAQFRITARAGTVSLVRTASVKSLTTTSIVLPAAVIEGQTAIFPVNISRTLPSVLLSGTVTMTFNGTPVSLPVNQTGTPAVVASARTNLPAGPLAITASYSGDSANEPSSASATYTVASRTPIVEISTSLPSPSVGVPFSLFARVHVDPNAPNAPAITGPVTILESGVPIGAANLVTSLTTPTPNTLLSRSFTALSFAPLHFTASFAGDSVYRAATSAAISPILQKAQPSISLLGQPPVFTIAGSTQPTPFLCGVPTTFNAVLSFPQSIGLSNRSFFVSATANDGSVRNFAASGTGTLVPSAAQLGSATGSAAFVVPFNTTSVTANFTGDSFLNAASSVPVPVALQPQPTTVQLTGLPATATNPLRITAAVANAVAPSCAINGPLGTVEFFDGTASLGIVPLPPNTTSDSAIVDGSSNTIFIGESKQVNLVVSRPVGAHNLRAHYSGDATHAPADSPVVTVTFQ